MGYQLLFKPSAEEVAILDENNIKWSDFCHENIRRIGSKKKQELLDKIAFRMVLIGIGGLLFALAPLFNDVWIILFEWLLGLSLAVVGMISLIYLALERYNGRRAKST